MNYTVIGKRWFEKVNGNTYHSVSVFKNGELLGFIPFDYGYGTMYAQNALDIIKKDDSTIKANALWQLKNEGHTLIDSVIDVQRKKDL